MARSTANRIAILISTPGRLAYMGGLWDRLAMAFLSQLGY